MSTTQVHESSQEITIAPGEIKEIVNEIDLSNIGNINGLTFQLTDDQFQQLLQQGLIKFCLSPEQIAQIRSSDLE